MLCPYCQLEYSVDEPCFCQPPTTARESAPDSEPEYTLPEGVQAANGIQVDGLTLLFT